MSKDEVIAILRLQSIPNIGDITAKKLIGSCGSPLAIFSDKLSALLKIDGIGRHTLKGLMDTEHLEAAQQEYEFIREQDIRLHYFMDDSYPNYLKHCIDGPILLFSSGDVALGHKKII